MVAKKLKKIQALAEVQKISLQSPQLVLPVREIYSEARSKLVCSHGQQQMLTLGLSPGKW